MNTLDTERFELTFDCRIKAKFLYWMGWRISAIAEYLQENEKTVHSWKARDEWDKDAPEGLAAQALEARLCTLYLLDKKHRAILRKLIYSNAKKTNMPDVKNT